MWNVLIEVNRLSEWCKVNNLLLNIFKTKELWDLCGEGPSVQVSGHGVGGQANLEHQHQGAAEEAQQRLYFLRILQKNCLPSDLLQAFYHCSIESVLTYSLCVWYGSSTSSDKKALQRIVRATERTIGCPLPTMCNR
ncbi:hypothetical protein CCH79_00018169, partial [Gambusia affinis]